MFQHIKFMRKFEPTNENIGLLSRQQQHRKLIYKNVD